MHSSITHYPMLESTQALYTELDKDLIFVELYLAEYVVLLYPMHPSPID